MIRKNEILFGIIYLILNVAFWGAFTNSKEMYSIWLVIAWVSEKFSSTNIISSKNFHHIRVYYIFLILGTTLIEIGESFANKLTEAGGVLNRLMVGGSMVIAMISVLAALWYFAKIIYDNYLIIKSLFRMIFSKNNSSSNK